MQIPHTVCDICGRMKQETNQWLIAVTDPASKTTGNVGIAFGPANAALDERHLFLIEDICGQACAHTRLSRYLDELQQPAPPTADAPEETAQ